MAQNCYKNKEKIQVNHNVNLLPQSSNFTRGEQKICRFQQNATTAAAGNSAGV